MYTVSLVLLSFRPQMARTKQTCRKVVPGPAPLQLVIAARMQPRVRITTAAYGITEQERKAVEWIHADQARQWYDQLTPIERAVVEYRIKVHIAAIKQSTPLSVRDKLYANLKSRVHFELAHMPTA